MVMASSRADFVTALIKYDPSWADKPKRLDFMYDEVDIHRTGRVSLHTFAFMRTRKKLMAEKGRHSESSTSSSDAGAATTPVSKTAAQPTKGASQTVAPASALAAFPQVLEGGDEREGSPLSIMMAAVAPLREAMTAFTRPPAASTLPPLIEDEDINAQAASIVQHLVETASPETSRATSIAALRRARSEQRASSRRRRYSAPSFSITNSPLSELVTSPSVGW